ncbi:hypothetical protein DTO013E5_9622 [Penicillium roqueforti]|uniref:MARVEL-like domain n=1 Tax=Penicillium roqueforti (strain FM164) TaxID=1365484 RepID=W6PS34_PENRF|nr:uncharacterized protein LCP9604111_6349 [Penicillium roqueforti]CDM26680.1 MARVEL-like domain [Penicillium roqueforti FM164]KAF9247650.1 hypothetical protein LCP9604111_6349 [Penicillium roqueforti]KAI1834991.1 hypothetical protein CBS147337_4545 [Penicillium roqueforti]KAI2676830.1 hypothetical protein CBS147355_5932 [Penicillium roqueforti]KAI2683704.1 hypothetical protein LCP963914a_6105 [Penicillium roqueforti]
MLSWINPLRIVQAILSLATIGLTAYEIASLYDKWSYSNVVYYMLFNGCWTTAIAVPYLGLAPLRFPRFSHEIAIPLIELLTGGLWLSGWIALAAMIPSPGACHYSSCHALQALIVVGAVQWATFVVTNTFAIIDLKNSRRNAKNHRDDASPEMSAADANTNGNTTTTATADGAV